MPLPSLKRFPFGCGFVGAAGRGVVYSIPKTMYKPDCPLGVCTTRTAGTGYTTGGMAYSVRACVTIIGCGQARANLLSFDVVSTHRLLYCFDDIDCERSQRAIVFQPYLYDGRRRWRVSVTN